LGLDGIANVPSDFSVIMAAIKKFLLPVYEALVAHDLFTSSWNKDTGLWNSRIR
jgi:hypothetical protein